MTELDPAVEYRNTPPQYRGRLSPRMEAMLRYVDEQGWMVNVLDLAMHTPWSLETRKALLRRGLLARTESGNVVYMTLAGWLWLQAHPET